MRQYPNVERLLTERGISQAADRALVIDWMRAVDGCRDAYNESAAAMFRPRVCLILPACSTAVGK